MRAHFAYFRYLLRHKWFVFLACRALGVPLWRALVHDWSKFLPSEWLAYVRTFYTPDGRKKTYEETADFARAWNAHQKRNKHHWQYWVMIWDRGEASVLAMPEVYAREMVADWIGAGRAITGRNETPTWYLSNRLKMTLHPDTRIFVEWLLRCAELFEDPLSVFPDPHPIMV